MTVSESLEASVGDGPGQVCFREALRVWARIGVLSFGGPTAQIALMHRIIVDEKRWLDEPLIKPDGYYGFADSEGWGCEVRSLHSISANPSPNAWRGEFHCVSDGVDQITSDTFKLTHLHGHIYLMKTSSLVRGPLPGQPAFSAALFEPCAQQ